MTNTLRIIKQKIGNDTEYLVSDTHETFDLWCTEYLVNADKTKLTLRYNKRFIGHINIENMVIEERDGTQ